jgi:hypothetical protein
MGTHAGPKLVTGSMSFYVDAASKKSLETTTIGWKDLIGKMPNATFTNATFSAVNSGIVYFGGTNSSQATVAESFFSTNSRTFDVWVRREQDVSTFNTVWGFWVPYLAMLNTEKFLFSYYNNLGGNNQKTHYSNQSFVDNRWYNVTCTVEYIIGVTTTSKIYIDGVLDSTLDWPSALTTTIIPTNVPIPHNLILGGWHYANPDTAFRGSISNFRIYERVLTQAEIEQNYYAMLARFRPDVAERAVLHLDAANRNSFTRVQDGWSNLATISPTTFQLSGATYDSSNGGIINFAGTPGSSASATFNQSNEMTWDVWFKRTANVGNGTENYNMVFASSNLPYLSFGWATISPDRFIFSWFTKFGANNPVQNNLVPTTIYSNNVWYNVTCTLRFDLTATTSTGKMYVNGVLVGTLTTAVGSTNILLGGASMRLANYDTSGQYPFNGSISNLRVYRRILTDAEILQSYNALKARFGY